MVSYFSADADAGAAVTAVVLCAYLGLMLSSGRPASNPVALMQVLEDHENEVWHVAFSHSGQLLGSASRDGTAIIWRVKANGEACLQHRLAGQDKPLCCLAFSPDDSMLLTCGSTPVVRTASLLMHAPCHRTAMPRCPQVL